MDTVAITPRGPFSLAASIGFLEGFPPAAYDRDAPDGVLRLAFPADDGRSSAGVTVRQAADGTVFADIGGDADPAVVRGQLARILSLDVDGSGFARVADADPVVAALAARYPGLRPVCFYSPYEAAAWAVIGQRIRVATAAAIKQRLAEQYGQRLAVAGTSLAAFPTPSVLRTVARIAGLSEVKTERLRAIADAALAGKLDAAVLRSMPSEEALAHLRALGGIGPFSAELVLIRGAGHPDIFPAHERRLHAAMADAYHLRDPNTDQLAKLATRWAPYRSWVALLLRIQQGKATGEIGRTTSRP